MITTEDQDTTLLNNRSKFKLIQGAKTQAQSITGCTNNMARTVRTKVYKFSELSEPAKQKAIEWYRNDHSYEPPAWIEENIDSMKKFAEMFPIKLTDWSVGGRGEGVSFRFKTDRDEIEELTGQRLATYIWNNYKTSLFKGKYYSIWSKTEKSFKHYKEGFPVLKSRHSRIFIDNSCVLTGYCADMEILDPIYTFLKKPRDINFRELLEECFEAWIKYCNDDSDYQQSDEYITEELLNADYEFTQDGRRF